MQMKMFEELYNSPKGRAMKAVQICIFTVVVALCGVIAYFFSRAIVDPHGNGS